jgi:hypothetical protein
MNNKHTFRTGEKVDVRPAEEILRTLDSCGTLDRLPFMPEMLDSCGKSFHVRRQVFKTCVDGHPLRRFQDDDVVILDGPRCDGSAHDGCKHGCRIFWKKAWLRPAGGDGTSADQSTASLESLRARLKSKTDAQHYFCQSTELYKATHGFPDAQKHRTFHLALRALRSGDISPTDVTKMTFRWLWLKLWRRADGDRWLRGTTQRTPTQSLGLQAGERVRVKSRAEIARTLDHRGRNRGLGICTEMQRCFGQEAEVDYRVDRLIEESTGKMRELTDSVVLKNINNSESLAEECLCYGQLGDCPRGEIMYWREIWLERVSGQQPNGHERDAPG